MSFSAIRDQETAVRFVRQMLVGSRIPNGLLFFGPGGVGKRLTALELAKAINCREGKGDACGACLACRKIAHGNHPDIKLVEPSDKTRLIKKDAIDEVNELASLRPFESEWRIFIIQDADRMNPPAQNHFLKTLEEPPGRSLFILVSEFPRVLLPTIRSRCQQVRFRALGKGTVKDLLQRERDLPGDIAESIAEIAGGQMSRALDLVDSEKRAVALSLTERLANGDDPVIMAEEFAKFLDEQRKGIEAAVKVDSADNGSDEAGREEMERSKAERLAYLAALVKRDMLEYLYLLQTWYRDEMVFAATRDSAKVWNKDHLKRLEAAQSPNAAAKIRAIETARMYLDRFINEERVFRDLFMALAAP
ncbi:MAG: DNA polymerase III subunit delta' [Candidatus Hydrogenedentes bacterium]|nr:DNA polymerase III subunit delta' [Candidatus Hydrogenedentota bacterium]